MPSNWPVLSLALGLAVVVAYLVTSFLGRRIERWLRALVPDDREHYLVDSPLPVIRGLLFLATAAIVALPAMQLTGYRFFAARDPVAFTEWLLSTGLSIVFILIAAYIIIRIGSSAIRQLERDMSAGTGLDVVE